MSTRHRQPRALVVGSGLAGLAAAEDLARAGCRVTVLTAARCGCDGASHRVHALAPWVLLTAPWIRGDGPREYMADLERRAGGAARPGLAAPLARQSHDVALRLIARLGLERLDEGPVLLPGDSWPRGVRCRPGRPGPMLAPLVAACVDAGVAILQRRIVVGLLMAGARVVGVLGLDRRTGAVDEHTADIVVLATGGAGAVFPLATAPRWCRGAATALGLAAGALLHRPDLTQALPVTATPPLFFPGSAALAGGRVMVGQERLAAGDLATATIAIAHALRAEVPVWLPPADAESLLPERVRAAFHGRTRVPLALALHHTMGGVAIDSWGRTSLPGLYACGEAAGGVQGMQRTMGTGLIEAALFGARAAAAAARDAATLEVAERPDRVTLVDCPGDPTAVDAELDALLAPLVAVRPADEVERAQRALEGMAVAPGPPTSEAGALAGIRRATALAMLHAAGGRAAQTTGRAQEWRDSWRAP